MKKILLLISLLLLTGCTVNYELVIDKDKIDEHITGTVTKEEITTDINETDIGMYDYLTHYDQNALYNQDDVFYNKQLEDKGDYYDYDASYTYIGNFKDSNIINSCFEDHIVKETDDFYYINLSGGFSCLYVDKINVNIKSNMAVIQNNADKVDGNIYSWVIKNPNNVDITLIVSKTIKALTPNQEKSIFTPYRIITFILLIVLIIISLFIYKRKNSVK